MKKTLLTVVATTTLLVSGCGQKDNEKGEDKVTTEQVTTENVTTENVTTEEKKDIPKVPKSVLLDIKKDYDDYKNGEIYVVAGEITKIENSEKYKIITTETKIDAKYISTMFYVPKDYDFKYKKGDTIKVSVSAKTNRLVHDLNTPEGMKEYKSKTKISEVKTAPLFKKIDDAAKKYKVTRGELLEQVIKAK